MSLSVVIPTLNEAAGIRTVLERLQPLRGRGHEIILVDGGSTDATLGLSRPLVDLALTDIGPGRARQMNAGARRARGRVLIFLHADTLLPEDADSLVSSGLAGENRIWGRFDARIMGFDDRRSRRSLLRMVAWMMNRRSALTGIATGDQAIFADRGIFESVDGFPDIPLMEDVALSRRLRRLGPPALVRTPVLTSGRRWEARGIVRTITLMWALRLGYSLGVSPERLARAYDHEPGPRSPVRDPTASRSFESPQL